MSPKDWQFFKKLSLVDYIDEMASTRWEWGLTDCTQSVNTWIVRIRGVDPLKAFRGKYHTPEEARTTAKRAGGFVTAIGVLFDLHMDRVIEPEDGDVGIIIVPTRERNILPVVGALLAIRLNPHWIVKSLHGVVGHGYTAHQVWRT